MPRKKGTAQSVKRVKATKGQPLIYDEVKTQTSVTLTSTAFDFYDAIAETLGVSRSEVLERVARHFNSEEVSLRLK